MNGPLRANKCTWIVCCVAWTFCVNTASQAHTADSWLLRNSSQIYCKSRICLRALTHFIMWGGKERASCIWFEYAFIHILHSVAHKGMQMPRIFSSMLSPVRIFTHKSHFKCKIRSQLCFQKVMQPAERERDKKSSANCFLLDVNPETRFQREQKDEDALPHKKCNEHSWSRTWQKTAPLSSSSSFLVNMIFFHHNDSNWNSKPTVCKPCWQKIQNNCCRSTRLLSAGCQTP